MIVETEPSEYQQIMEENQILDCKSIRAVRGRRADFSALAQDCVAFANASGGQLLIGIEDGATDPPPEQHVEDSLLEQIRKRIGELTVNVQVLTDRRTAGNDGQYILVTVPRAAGVASTSDGRYFLRVGDSCVPVVGDAVLRLANERPQLPWELMTAQGASISAVAPAKLARLVDELKASDRVKLSVKEKSPQELLDHYHLAIGDQLTNLGVLLLGGSVDRARLGCAPVIQAIRYDDRGVKIEKLTWDDHRLSPIELLDAVWSEIPDFRERYELPRGLFRESVPAFEPEVVRELLVNALVHRPYTQRGDIFLNLHPDRLEVVNPGRLPLGVTPANILHASRRRNDALARIFHDLRLMEREGSGFDMMYEKLLQSGRQIPVTKEGPDSVHVTVPRRVLHPGVIQLLGEADQRFQLSQRERICLGLLAATEGATATVLAQSLSLDDPSELRHWMGRLLDLGLIRQTGRTRATRYFVPPRLLRASGLDLKTTLQRVEPHRLRALILEDLERYPKSSSTDIHKRIGAEIPFRTFRRALIQLVEKGHVTAVGERRWRRYSSAAPIGRKSHDGQ
jgi:ATP-dependent DNA helicase RecG